MRLLLFLHWQSIHVYSHILLAAICDDRSCSWNSCRSLPGMGQSGVLLVLSISLSSSTASRWMHKHNMDKSMDRRIHCCSNRRRWDILPWTEGCGNWGSFPIEWWENPWYCCFDYFYLWECREFFIWKECPTNTKSEYDIQYSYSTQDDANIKYDI